MSTTINSKPRYILSHTIPLNNLYHALEWTVGMFKGRLRVRQGVHPPRGSGIYVYYQLINFIFLKVFNIIK